jgi:hypothetical protein
MECQSERRVKSAQAQSWPMRRFVCGASVIAVIATLSSLSQTATASDVKTVVFLGDTWAQQTDYYVERSRPFDGYWETWPFGAYLHRAKAGWYFARLYSNSEELIRAYARRQREGVWNITRGFASGPRLGTARKRTATSWDIYNWKGQHLGYTIGPDGVPAALNYLLFCSYCPTGPSMCGPCVA